MNKQSPPKKNEAPTPSKVSGASGKQLSFLPPPPFCPTWPTRGTLADRASGTFIAGQMLVPPRFEQRMQSLGLAAPLLKLVGPIKAIETPITAEPNPNQVMDRYHLPSEYTAQALELNGGVE